MAKIEKLTATTNMPEEILEKCSLSKLYPLYRLIEPITRTVCESVDGKIKKTHERCYSIWGKEEPCANCTSHRAFVENVVIEKLESSEDTTLLVCSVPIEIRGVKYTLELAKDVCKTFLMDLPFSEGVKDLKGIIEHVNDLATKEMFTGLYNKNYISQELRILAQSESAVLSGAIFDLDNFKSINDTHGHTTGDEVIKSFANVLLAIAKGTTIIAARIGGDEFMLLCPDMTEEDCQKLCIEIEEEVDELPLMDKEGNSFKIHASWAVGTYVCGEPMSRFVDRMDEKMYVQKRKYAHMTRRISDV